MTIDQNKGTIMKAITLKKLEQIIEFIPSEKAELILSDINANKCVEMWTRYINTMFLTYND